MLVCPPPTPASLFHRKETPHSAAAAAAGAPHKAERSVSKARFLSVSLQQEQARSTPTDSSPPPARNTRTAFPNPGPSPQTAALSAPPQKQSLLRMMWQKEKEKRKSLALYLRACLTHVKPRDLWEFLQQCLLAYAPPPSRPHPRTPQSTGVQRRAGHTWAPQKRRAGWSGAGRGGALQPDPFRISAKTLSLLFLLFFGAQPFNLKGRVKPC